MSTTIIIICIAQFLSTLSLRRATRSRRWRPRPPNNFYPRSPCGERPYGRINDISRLIFLSTLSLRRATILGRRVRYRKQFLSTLSLRRATNSCNLQYTDTDYFYPRSPCGERLAGSQAKRKPWLISIHALLAESD